MAPIISPLQQLQSRAHEAREVMLASQERYLALKHDLGNEAERIRRLPLSPGMRADMLAHIPGSWEPFDYEPVSHMRAFNGRIVCALGGVRGDDPSGAWAAVATEKALKDLGAMPEGLEIQFAALTLAAQAPEDMRAQASRRVQAALAGLGIPGDWTDGHVYSTQACQHVVTGVAGNLLARWWYRRAFRAGLSPEDALAAERWAWDGSGLRDHVGLHDLSKELARELGTGGAKKTRKTRAAG